MTATLSQQDRGKEVVHRTERIGVVTDISGDTVYVDPQWDHLPESLRDELDWDPDDQHHTLPERLVADVRNDQVYLRDDVL